MKAENASRRRNKYWNGADLVMEVVSGDAKDRKRDHVDKVNDYALGGIPEYWIIDPEQKVVRVLALDGSAYRVHGEFRAGETATSVLLPGFTLGVDAILAADRT
jgi:Uma2 family endonuclease